MKQKMSDTYETDSKQERSSTDQREGAQSKDKMSVSKNWCSSKNKNLSLNS